MSLVNAAASAGTFTWGASFLAVIRGTHFSAITFDIVARLAPFISIPLHAVARRSVYERASSAGIGTEAACWRRPTFSRHISDKYASVFERHPHDYKQQTIFVSLKRISLHGLRQRTHHRPTDSFVEISVCSEDDVKIHTRVIEDNLNPVWEFSPPHKLRLYPSSSIRFAIYRRRKTESLGAKLLGVFEAPLFTFLDERDVLHPLDTKKCITTETGKIRVDLEVDTSGVKVELDSMFDNAEEKLHHAKDVLAESDHGGSAMKHAMDSLSQLVKLVDGIVEIHPWCKTAWTLLSSVCKAINSQRDNDGAVNELLDELRNALAYTRECRDLKPVPNTTNVIKALARLVAEGATVIDAYMKHSRAGRTLRSASGVSQELDRIKHCRAQLVELQEKLKLNLLICTWKNGTVHPITRSPAALQS
ncbi:hypothetical protein NM688_g2261 [Phlebia brevispora]|uniref:Uncharacterized protein n=1 Tax=Phlebia brevispora TaxID=194682 RepID=A0ACC1T9H2_9APHY|nr:hypothetical protein NM688_g2261 [Phlebia brevispora]